MPGARCCETFPRRGGSLVYIRAIVKLLGKWFLIAVLAAPFCTRAADMLNWDADHNRVDAEITTWTVPQLLQRIAAITGWQVLMEPSINEVVPTKFKDKNSGEALQRLLGKLNYALAPETNSSSRLYVFRTSRNDATKTIAPMIVSGSATNKGRIENELIVTLKPGEKIEDLAKRLGAKVVGKIDGMNAYRLRFDDAEAAQAGRDVAKADSSVESTDYNYAIDRPESMMPLGGEARPLGLTPKAMPDGQYVVVGLIDTAVQGKDSGISDFLLPGISVAGDAGIVDALTHGPAMAQTILRGLELSSKDSNTVVRILPVDVYGPNATSSSFDVAKGVYEAVNHGANILNLSLGYASPDGTANGTESSFLYNTLKSASDQGVKIYAAAGNEHTTAPTLPAAWSFVTAVTATDSKGKIASYANYGSFVDASAPGTSIVNFRGQSYVVTGTSSSTAYVSGKAAAQAEAAKKN